MMRLLTILVLMFYGSWLYAGCSPHLGLVSINEISKDHNWRNDPTDFVEIKKLDNQVSNSLINTWTVEICENFLLFFQTCSGPVSVSTLQQTGKYWLWQGDPIPAEYIDWNFGFDVTLKDENGDVVDYIASNGVTYQYEDCDYPYDTSLSSGPSTRRAKRQPDGAGDWEVPFGNSESETPAESNDGETPPVGAPDLSFLEDVTVTQGQTATFTFQLSNSYASNVVIEYATYNGTGIAGTHYTSTNGSATIASGQTSVTIDVPTLSSGDANVQTFYLVIESASNANVVDQLAIATILPAGAIDHFSIIHSGSAANCEVASVVIQAKDAAGDTLSNYVGSISMSTSTGNGDWSVIDADGTFSPGASDSGNATIDFVATDNGEIILGLANTHAEIISIDVDDGLGNSETSNGAIPADDPNLVFALSRFKFIYGTGSAPASETISNKISGRPFSTGLGSNPLKLRAITTDLDTGVCTALFNGNNVVQLAVECIEPSTCSNTSGTEFEISNTELAENLSGAVSTYTNVSLNFSGNGTADLPSVYKDAGRIRLHARYQQAGDNVIGSSQNIDVIPSGFCVQTTDANAECSGPNYWECTAFKKAGELFNVTVSAQGWLADGDSDFCDNNFDLSSFSSAVDVIPQLISPSGGNLGLLNTASISLVNGSYSGTLSWSEVGALNIQVGGNGYLSGALPTSNSDTIGRFIPFEFFATGKDDGTFNNAQTGFSYIGQIDLSGNGAIQYGTQPWIEFIARGTAGNTVQNYLLGSFFKSPTPSFLISTATLGRDGATPLSITSGFDVPTFTYNGTTFTYRMSLSSNDHFMFNKTPNALVGPFANDIELELDTLIDTDGVGIINSQTLSPTGGPVRYGRISINNAYGPETSPLDQAWLAQYFDGNDFVLNALDTDTNVDSADLIPASIVITDVGDTSDPLVIGDSTLSGMTTFNLGQATLQWSSPLGGRYGSFEFGYDAPVWLEYDWSGSGLEDPKGLVTFGRYRGHDKMIYWKEITY